MVLSAVGRQSGILLLWTGVVVFLTWPLAAHLTTHLPGIAIGGPLDSLLVGWALAHQSHAILTAPCSLPDGNIYWPSRRALYYGEAGFGAVPYFMPHRGPRTLPGPPAGAPGARPWAKRPARTARSSTAARC